MSSRDLRLDKIEESPGARDFLKAERIHTLSSRAERMIKRQSASEMGLAEIVEAHSHTPSPVNSPKQHHLASPTRMAKTQSVPTESMEHKLKVTAIHLLRQLSAPDNREYTGTGHGGQGKGAGALPFTNNMINIHDHLEEGAEHSTTTDDERSPRERGNEDSISYIYGDEDAEHHTLPTYNSPKSSPNRRSRTGMTDRESQEPEISNLELEPKAKAPIGVIDAVEEEDDVGRHSRSVTLTLELDAEIVENIEIVMTDMENSSEEVVNEMDTKGDHTGNAVSLIID